MPNHDLIAVLQQAADNVGDGKTFGLAVIQITKAPDGGWGVITTYQGPLLNLIAGTTKLTHDLNVTLNAYQAKEPPKVST